MLRRALIVRKRSPRNWAEQSGGTDQKVLMHPELTSFLKPRRSAKCRAAKPTILVVDDEQMALV